MTQSNARSGLLLKVKTVGAVGHSAGAFEAGDDWDGWDGEWDADGWDGDAGYDGWDGDGF